MSDYHTALPPTVMVANAAVTDVDTSTNDEKCTICNEAGILTQCDQCCQWNHWRCVDPYHQPTSGEFLCGNCRDITGRHPVPWESMAILTLDCVVCHEKKPATEFVNKILPECPCNQGRPRLCAHCAYNMADGADEYNTEARCPLCKQPWEAFVAPSVDGVPAEVIRLDHVRGIDDAGNPPAPTYPATAVSDDDIRQWLLGSGAETPMMGIPAAASAAADTSYTHTGMEIFNAVPPINDDDDADSIIGDVDPSAGAHARRGGADRCSGKAAKPKKTIAKKGWSSARSKDTLLNRDKSTFKPLNPDKAKHNPPVRITGSKMRKLTDTGHVQTHYDSQRQRNRILRKAFEQHAAEDISCPNQTDASVISAHCKILAIRDGVPIGAKADSSAMKYCGYVAKFVRANGFALKSEFVASNKVRAEGIALDIGNDIVAAKPTLKTTAAKYAQTHMAAFRLYCKLLLKEAAGTINADPPPDEDDEEEGEEEDEEEDDEEDDEEDGEEDDEE